MSMSFTMKASGIPVGVYAAEFIAIEEFKENLDRFGEAVVLRWKVIDGPLAGQESTRVCSKRLSPKSNLAKLAIAMKGAPIETGEAFSFEKFIGQKGTIVVEETDGGSTRVATFLRS